MDLIQHVLDRIDALDAKTDEKLDLILIQTTKTNGRVNNLEKICDRQQELIDAHQTLLNTLNEVSHYNKGRDRIVFILTGIVGTVIAGIIQHYLTIK